MAGQDYKRTIPAGGATRINANGETYLFCKFSDRDVTVDIAGKKVVMRSGSYQEFAPLAGQNSTVTIYNEDQERPAAVVFVMGVGTYDEKIIRGEVGIVPVLRNADGTTKPDTRHQVAIDLMPSRLMVESYQAADQIAQTKTNSFIDTARNSSSMNKVFEYQGHIIHAARNVSTSKKTMENWYDYKLNLVKQTWLDLWGEDITALDIQEGFNGDLYRITNSGEIYRGIAGQSVLIHAISDPSEPKTICALDSGLLAFNDEGAYWLIGYSGGEVKAGQVDLPFAWANNVKARLDRFTGRVVVMEESGNIVELDQNTLEPVSYQDGWGDDISDIQLGLDGFVPFRNSVYGCVRTTAASKMGQWARVDYTTKPEFQARRPGCEMVSAMVKPDQVPQITADIAISVGVDAVVVQGEVIRAALEYYYKRRAPEDYLDHVYSFDVQRDETGAPFRRLYTGNETFARQNIDDEFGTQLPGQIVLTIDNELTMGERI